MFVLFFYEGNLPLLKKLSGKTVPCRESAWLYFIPVLLKNFLLGIVIHVCIDVYYFVCLG